MVVEIPFIKKLTLPQFSLPFLSKGKPNRIAGLDIGTYSAKVIQLKYEGERAILETYGELLSAGYLKEGSPIGGGGFLRYTEEDVAGLIKDLLKESNVATNEAVFPVPAAASFVTLISFPKLSEQEIESAIQFEARKYVPIPISEVLLDWEIYQPDENHEEIEVLLVAVPRETSDKIQRIAGLAGITLKGLEVETFSLMRSLARIEPLPTVIVNIGHLSTSMVITDLGRVRLSHNLDRGSYEWTRALARGLEVSEERAEAMKREVGLSERIEEREITSVISPLVESLFSDIQRMLSLYNRRGSRRVQKVNLTGGGSNLRGLVEFAASKFGVEVARGNPFGRVVAPVFMQPIFREIGQSFSVAVGAALREITSH
ncbi:MAG: Type IV pilus assembly protein PilM [Parcubacteria group bacterium GW2011_GWA2_45_30]|nr:MAG: Type IV pilus assembly protein PilM [Parcubacteria group bacterium GW2011_GWA2_45_30]